MNDGAAALINLLVRKRLVHICCVTEMLDFDFAPFALHAMGCTRVIKNNDILVTTLDYHSWDLQESTHNDEWENVKRFYAEMVNGMVISAAISPWYDLRIVLDNHVIIECLIANAYAHYGQEQEQWVLFETKENEKGKRAFLTAYNKGMTFHVI